MPSIYRNGIQYSSNGGLESAAITAGVIVPYAGDTAPVGWLLCDGSAVSRTTYSVLFDVIGTTYGAGDGSTTFNVPDLRGAFPVGADSAIDVGDTGGEKNHTLTIDEMPNHNHPQSVLLNTSSGGANGYSASYAANNSWSSVGSQGGGQAHNNMPPYTAVNYIISIGSQNESDHSWTGYGNAVTLNSYTSSNMYTVPSDGVVQATIDWNAGSYCYIFDGGGNALAAVSTNGSVGNAFTSALVFKGMKIYIQKSTSNSNAYFRPFIIGR